MPVIANVQDEAAAVTLSLQAGASVIEATVTPNIQAFTVTVEPTQGRAGEPGPPGSNSVNHVAAVTLSGHRAVYLADDGLRYAGSDLDEEVLGITPGAIYAGAVGPVTIGDELTDPGWTWTRGPIWAGLDGVLTQIPPTSGSLKEVGVALTATRILVRVRAAIALAGS